VQIPVLTIAIFRVIRLVRVQFNLQRLGVYCAECRGWYDIPVLIGSDQEDHPLMTTSLWVCSPAPAVWENKSAQTIIRNQIENNSIENSILFFVVKIIKFLRWVWIICCLCQCHNIIQTFFLHPGKVHGWCNNFKAETKNRVVCHTKIFWNESKIACKKFFSKLSCKNEEYKYLMVHSCTITSHNASLITPPKTEIRRMKKCSKG